MLRPHCTLASFIRHHAVQTSHRDTINATQFLAMFHVPRGVLASAFTETCLLDSGIRQLLGCTTLGLDVSSSACTELRVLTSVNPLGMLADCCCMPLVVLLFGWCSPFAAAPFAEGCTLCAAGTLKDLGGCFGFNAGCRVASW